MKRLEMPENKIRDQIDELNREVKCRLAPSQIHGVGVFAIRDIRKGEKMFCLGRPNPPSYLIPPERLDGIRSEILEIILGRWPFAKEGYAFRSPNDDARMVSFMNHSEDPNYRDDVALRDIKKGEEVTENYSDLEY